MKHDWSFQRNLANNSCEETRPERPERDAGQRRMAEHGWIGDLVCFVDLAEVASTMVAAVEAKWNAVQAARIQFRMGFVSAI
jgi:hypothetical protein